MIFQEPPRSLNPVFSVGDQIGEAIRMHKPISKQDERAEVIRLLREVRMSEPDRRVESIPHELSAA